MWITQIKKKNEVLPKFIKVYLPVRTPFAFGLLLGAETAAKTSNMTMTAVSSEYS